jgi:hypothetical protein
MHQHRRDAQRVVFIPLEKMRTVLPGDPTSPSAQVVPDPRNIIGFDLRTYFGCIDDTATGFAMMRSRLSDLTPFRITDTLVRLETSKISLNPCWKVP